MGMRDEMFRAKVLIFMVPLVLPIGQPPARATDGRLDVVECAPAYEASSLRDRPADEAVLEPTDGYDGLHLISPDVE